MVLFLITLCLVGYFGWVEWLEHLEKMEKIKQGIDPDRSYG